jgi:trehalose-6-phosphatase
MTTQITICRNGFSLDRFFRLVRAEPRRLLMLDYEGVLAPLLEEDIPGDDSGSLRALLNTMLGARHTRVVVVSERPAEQVPRRLHLTTPIEIFGSNGLEHLRPHGAYTWSDPSARARAGFDQADAWCQAWGVGGQFEGRLASVALYCDRLPAGEAARIRAAALDQWEQIAWASGLELRARGGTIELITERYGKDRLVERLLDEVGEGGAVAYLGDGPDDERAFRALHSRGLGVLIASEVRQTFASPQLSPGDETFRFLRRWHQQADGARTA